MSSNGRGKRAFTPAEYQRSKIAQEARRVAQTRLLALHRAEFETIVNEERAARGLSPKMTRIPRSELERLANLALEAGLS